ncbi:MAG: hypothetical protein ACE366_03890 [Bradymonadia bacterium]
MTTIIFLILFNLPNLIEGAQDPVDGWVAPDVDLQALDCTPMPIEAARQALPGRIPPPSARGDYIDRRAVICRERLMPRGVRVPRDDALLLELRSTAKDMAGLVAGLSEDERGRLWMVEAFHPDPRMSHKISFAVKNALLDQGVKVSDRTPTLAAGDIAVIGGVEAARAYPLACTRYAAAGSLGSNHGLLAVVLRDARETTLHGGVCLDGRWRWLR